MIWALIMEHDEIEENVHLFTSESGQHVVAVMHWVVWLMLLVWHPLKRFGGMLCHLLNWHSEAAELPILE